MKMIKMPHDNMKNIKMPHDNIMPMNNDLCTHANDLSICTHANDLSICTHANDLSICTHANNNLCNDDLCNNDYDLCNNDLYICNYNLCNSALYICNHTNDLISNITMSTMSNTTIPHAKWSLWLNHIDIKIPHANINIKIPYDKYFTWSNQILDSMLINKSKPYPFFLEFFIRTIFNFTKAFTWFHHSENVTNRCKLVNMHLRRNLYRKHDFVVYIQSISSPRALCDCSYIFSLFISYHIDTLEQLAHCLHNTPLYKTFSDTQQSFVGGGTSLFSFAELQPDISNNNNLRSSKFRYCEYSLKANTSTLDPSLIAIDHPLHLLLPKLSVSDLKLIALSHGIYTHTKMR
jgi:hypothetical protein